MTFGAFISTRRKEAKLNLRDTAKHLGISNGYLCDIEQGRRPAPEGAFVERISSFLELDKQEHEMLLDLAADSRQTVPADLPDYIRQHDIVRAALRVAKEVDATDEEWKAFMELMPMAQAPALGEVVSNTSAKERQHKCEVLISEAIVLLETMKAADKDHRVFKLQFEAGEFDMVIYDQKENSCEIFEIKHSSKQVPLQYRHLVDEDKCQRTERRFGPIQGRYILYRGEDVQMENGVQYWNVENYLKALPTLDIVQAQETGTQSIEPTL